MLKDLEKEINKSMSYLTPGFPRWCSGKNLPPMQEAQETQVQSLGREDLLKEEMATHSVTLAWEIPRTEDAGGLQSMGLRKVRLSKRQESIPAEAAPHNH